MRKTVSLFTRRFPKVGFWYSDHEPDLPNPREHVDPDWAREKLARVVTYLDAAYFTDEISLGWSECRFCGKANGTRDLTDGAFVFPEGFSHYLREHVVRPPPEFLQHVRDLDYQLPGLSEFRAL